MPTYEYKCKKCNHHFEEMQSITANPLTDCPECDGTVERIISGGAGFVFKGSGFYITENRSAKYKESAKNDSETKSESKETKKTAEKKPDTAKTIKDTKKKQDAR